MRKALAVSLALFLSACGVVGGQGPYVPPAGPDMAESEVKLVQVPAGPDSSGSDVRLLWVKTAGGARVRLGQNVHAVELSKAVGVPVQCAFEESGVDGTHACVPTGPVAVLAPTYFFDNACTIRLHVETPECRSCLSHAPMVGVYYVAAPNTSVTCVNKARAFTLKRISTPQIVYYQNGGKCVTYGTGQTNFNYWLLDKEVTALLPTGTLGVE